MFSLRLQSGPVGRDDRDNDSQLKLCGLKRSCHGTPLRPRPNSSLFGRLCRNATNHLGCHAERERSSRFSAPHEKQILRRTARNLIEMGVMLSLNRSPPPTRELNQGHDLLMLGDFDLPFEPFADHLCECVRCRRLAVHDVGHARRFLKCAEPTQYLALIRVRGEVPSLISRL